MDAGYERDSGKRYAGEEAVSGRIHDQTGDREKEREVTTLKVVREKRPGWCLPW